MVNNSMVQVIIQPNQPTDQVIFYLLFELHDIIVVGVKGASGNMSLLAQLLNGYSIDLFMLVQLDERFLQGVLRLGTSCLFDFRDS